MPTTPGKPKQFAFILSEDEHRMLQELAEDDGRSAANWLRMIIRREHEQRPPRSMGEIAKLASKQRTVGEITASLRRRGIPEIAADLQGRKAQRSRKKGSS